MDSFINTKLFTVSNVVAIGAILIFWSVVGYALNTILASNPGASG